MRRHHLQCGLRASPPGLCGVETAELHSPSAASSRARPTTGRRSPTTATGCTGTSSTKRTALQRPGSEIQADLLVQRGLRHRGDPGMRPGQGAGAVQLLPRSAVQAGRGEDDEAAGREDG